VRRANVREVSPAARWLFVAVVAGGILVGSVVPAPGGGLATPGPLGVGLDKWVHAASYAVLSAVLVLALDDGERPVAVVVVVALVAAVTYGYGMELVQAALPSRDYDLLDLAADGVGAAAAAGVAWLRLR